MTERLYYTDALLTEFDATVVALADEGRVVYLDRTAFYPTSGGQPHDTGTLSAVAVVDVIDEEDRVAHRLRQPSSLSVGDVARGVIDCSRRVDHMQQHTGQHLISAIFEDLFGAKTVSVHFGALDSTLDLDVEGITRDQLVRAEIAANAAVAEARPVMVTFEDARSAAGLRKPSDRQGVIRVVSIDRLDRSACGGTHVRTTAEIGAILLRDTEKVRKTTRVRFLCGDRAIARARADHEALSAIAASLSTSVAEAATVVAAQAETLHATDQQRRKLERDLAAYRARDLVDRAVATPSGRRVVEIDAAGSMEEAKSLAQAIIALPGGVAVAAVADPPSVLLAASESSGVDAGRALKEALSAAGGRGGGSPRIAQGSAPSAAIARAIARELVDQLVAGA